MIEGLLFVQLLDGISVQLHNDFMNLFHVFLLILFSSGICWGFAIQINGFWFRQMNNTI